MDLSGRRLESAPRTTLVIRRLRRDDAEPIAAAFAAQGWHKPAEQYHAYATEQESGRRITLVAEVEGVFAGYLNVLWESWYSAFREAAIPEIADFNVLERFQRRGIGSALMDRAEALIAERSPVAGIGVGLTANYGAAQVLYVRRGYVPDGRGIISGAEPVRPGASVAADDDLVLYLTRRLR